MLSGSGNGTLLGPQKTNAGAMKAPAAMVGGVLDVERMTHEQFRALPDTGTLQYRGQSMTKAAFIQQKMNAGSRGTTASPGKPMMSFDQARAEFQQKEKAELETANARVQAVMDRMTSAQRQVESSPRYVALAKEATELQRRYASAGGEEKARLKERALRIHEELKKLESGGSE